MKIIYEQGDVIFNFNNCNYGIVLKELDDETIQILEISYKDAFINTVPKAALSYKGNVKLKSKLYDIVESVQKGEETHGKIFYYCDRRKCDNCNNIDCEYTSDITHARNFEKDASGNYVEGEYMRG